jgi:hypothetical protein
MWWLEAVLWLYRFGWVLLTAGALLLLLGVWGARRTRPAPQPPTERPVSYVPGKAEVGR